MHPYFLYKRIGNLSFILFFVAILSFVFVSSSLMKLISFLLIFVFLILALVFLVKSVNYSKEQQEIMKRNFNFRMKDMAIPLIVGGLFIIVIFFVKFFKDRDVLWFIFIFFGIFAILIGIYLKKKYGV